MNKSIDTFFLQQIRRLYDAPTLRRWIRDATKLRAKKEQVARWLWVLKLLESEEKA